MSLAFKIYKKQRNIILLLVKKKVMELWSLLALNGLSLSSEEAEKTASSSQAGCCDLNSRRGYNEDTCSASLK